MFDKIKSFFKDPLQLLLGFVLAAVAVGGLVWFFTTPSIRSFLTEQEPENDLPKSTGNLDSLIKFPILTQNNGNNTPEPNVVVVDNNHSDTNISGIQIEEGQIASGISVVRDQPPPPAEGPEQNGGAEGPEQNGGAEGPEQNGGAEGPEQNGGAEGPEQNGGAEGPEQNGGAEGPEQNGGAEGPEQNGGAEGPEQNGGAEGPEQNGGAEGPEQNGGAEGPEQNGGAEGPEQNGGAEGPEQNGGAEGPEQNGGAEGPEQNGGAEGPEQNGGPPRASIPVNPRIVTEVQVNFSKETLDSLEKQIRMSPDVLSISRIRMHGKPALAYTTKGSTPHNIAYLDGNNIYYLLSQDFIPES